MIKRVGWDDLYILNIQEIDSQHKKLILIANELYDIAVGDNENYENLKSKVMKDLSDYISYHFSAEEKFLKNYGYTAWEAHKMAHDNFINETNFQIKKLSSGTKTDALNFYSYISSWILTHIAKADKVWANFVRPKL